MKNQKNNKIFSYLFPIILSLFAWVIGTIIVNSVRSKAQRDTAIQVSNQVKEAIAGINNENNVSKYPDFSTLSSLHKLNVISNFESWTPNSRKDPKKVKTIIVIDKGSVSQGYLYIKTSVENRAMSRWESIFVQMNFNGGHLLRNKSLPVPPSDKTELLYTLDDVSYINRGPYREDGNYNKTNLLNQFRPGAQIQIDAFISSLKPATIEEISLYYDCAESDSCSLSIR